MRKGSEVKRKYHWWVPLRRKHPGVAVASLLDRRKKQAIGTADCELWRSAVPYLQSEWQEGPVKVPLCAKQLQRCERGEEIWQQSRDKSYRCGSRRGFLCKDHQPTSSKFGTDKRIISSCVVCPVWPEQPSLATCTFTCTYPAMDRFTFVGPKTDTPFLYQITKRNENHKRKGNHKKERIRT